MLSFIQKRAEALRPHASPDPSPHRPGPQHGALLSARRAAGLVRAVEFHQGVGPHRPAGAGEGECHFRPSARPTPHLTGIAARRSGAATYEIQTKGNESTLHAVAATDD